MGLRDIRQRLKDQKGVTLIEQVFAALFVGFLIMVWVNSIRVSTKGTLMSKNNLRAQNLGLSKLEDVKNTAIQASYGSAWNQVTQTATVKAYLTPQVSVIESRSFTWRVLTDFAYMPLSTSPNALPTTSSAATPNLWIRAEVSWKDVAGPKVLTMTGYSSDIRQ